MKILYLLWAGKYGLQEGQKKKMIVPDWPTTI
jgi:hypothetical protein